MNQQAADRYDQLLHGLTLAQQKDARQVSALLNKYPEAALHRHLKGWAEGVSSTLLPPKSTLEEKVQPDAMSAPHTAAPHAAAARAGGKGVDAAPTEPMRAMDDDEDKDGSESAVVVLKHKSTGSSVKYQFLIEGLPVWGTAVSHPQPEYVAAIADYDRRHKIGPPGAGSAGSTNLAAASSSSDAAAGPPPATRPAPSLAPAAGLARPPAAAAPAAAPASTSASPRKQMAKRSKPFPSLARGATADAAAAASGAPVHAEASAGLAARLHDQAARAQREADELRAAAEEAQRRETAQRREEAQRRETAPAAADKEDEGEEGSAQEGRARAKSSNAERAGRGASRARAAAVAASGGRSPRPSRGTRSSAAAVAGGDGNEEDEHGSPSPRAVAPLGSSRESRSKSQAAAAPPAAEPTAAAVQRAQRLRRRLEKARDDDEEEEPGSDGRGEESRSHGPVAELARQSSALHAQGTDPLEDMLKQPKRAPSGLRAGGKRMRLTEPASSSRAPDAEQPQWTAADDLDGVEDDEIENSDDDAEGAVSYTRLPPAKRTADLPPNLSPQRGGDGQGGSAGRGNRGGHAQQAAAARSKKVPFSLDEEAWIKEGVTRFQTATNLWACILKAYPFDKKRTSVDLKDKWRNMQKRAA